MAPEPRKNRGPSARDRVGPARKAVEALVEASRDASREELVVSTSGNFSVRLDEGRFAITVARSQLGKLTKDDVVVLPVRPAAAPPEPAQPRPAGRDDLRRRPSRETPMHRAIYDAHDQIGSVLHFQSIAGTVLACRVGPLPDLTFLPEVAVYVRGIAEVPYLPPGSDALARAVTEALRDPDVHVVQLRNHGQIVVGDTPQQAVERAVFFELAARVFLMSEGGTGLRRFSPDELRVLRSY